MDQFAVSVPDFQGVGKTSVGEEVRVWLFDFVDDKQFPIRGEVFRKIDAGLSDFSGVSCGNIDLHYLRSSIVVKESDVMRRLKKILISPDL